MVRQHWHVVITTKGWHGIQKALASPFDIILLDTNLSDIDGFSACRVLAESPATSLIPVIFHTHADSIDDCLKGFSCGGVDYLIKPCRPQEVIARMRTHLRIFHQRPAPVMVYCVPCGTGTPFVVKRTATIFKLSSAPLTTLSDDPAGGQRNSAFKPVAFVRSMIAPPQPVAILAVGYIE
jgi:DNA-binding response OmpR family regulator